MEQWNILLLNYYSSKINLIRLIFGALEFFFMNYNTESLHITMLILVRNFIEKPKIKNFNSKMDFHLKWKHLLRKCSNTILNRDLMLQNYYRILFSIDYNQSRKNNHLKFRELNNFLKCNKFKKSQFKFKEHFRIHLNP